MQFGLIGKKLEHSFSKELHKRIDKYSYELQELQPNDLAVFFEQRDFQGINVTIPYKQDVISFLDEISLTAQQIGAVNIVVNRNGKLLGDNTDFYGFLELLKFVKFDVKGRRVLVLGTGGTAKTVIAVLKYLQCQKIVKVSHSGTKDAISYDDVGIYNDFDYIVNTTPVGMYPNIKDVPIDLNVFKHLQGVIDVVYNPLQTQLLLNAKKRKIKYCGGLYMLVAQAVYAFALFQNIEPQVCRIKDIYFDLLHEKQNLVLIGMPTCGKSSVGKLIAKRLQKKFFDTDVLFENIYGKTVTDFILQNGEKAFRKLEKNIVNQLSLKNGCVIATGGGTVLDESNVTNLQYNGKLIFLDRKLELLKTLQDRPLSCDKYKLQKLYKDRRLIYMRAADVVVNGNGSEKEVVNLVLKEWQKE